VGRFIPADFNLVSGDIVPACNAFSYMGQPFGVMLDVLARNTTGVQTRNYTGLFAKGDAYLSVANNKDGNSLSSRLRSLQPLPWLNGRAALTTGSSEFVRLSDTQQDGPYKSLLFGLYMKDNDGDKTLIASPNFNDAVVGNCSGSGCNARLIDSVPMQVYFGRLLAGTGAGLASAPLAVPLQMQYYEAGNWQLNKLDQCTELSLANQGFTFLNPSQTFDATSRDLNLGASRKIRLGLGDPPPGVMLARAKDGEIMFQFAKPEISVRIPYKVDLSKQPSQPRWLSDPITLQGEAIFGSSRGNDRIIYRREVMP
jgi:MSHA biogenesis protein MshQ